MLQEWLVADLSALPLISGVKKVIMSLLSSSGLANNKGRIEIADDGASVRSHRSTTRRGATEDHHDDELPGQSDEEEDLPDDMFNFTKSSASFETVQLDQCLTQPFQTQLFCSTPACAPLADVVLV